LGKGGKNKGSKTINVEKTKTTQEKKYVGEKDTIAFPKIMCPGSLNVDLIFVLNTIYILFSPFFYPRKQHSPPKNRN